MKISLTPIITTSFLMVGLGINPLQAKTTADVRLYTLNCGTIQMHDIADFSDTGFYPHESGILADPCFLIKHNNTWMLWDLGLGDQYVGKTVDNTQYGVTLSVPVSLVAQLKEIGLTPEDIQYVGLSHIHFDHTGNADLFPHATWLMQRVEYQSLQDTPLPEAADPKLLAMIQTAPKQLLDGDDDVFGDGTVIILRTPGHTIGHESLELNLPKSGTVFLSGDLYHSRTAYQYKLVPSFNESRSDTIASMARMDGLLKNSKGRLVIQHSQSDFAALPPFPQFLQ